ncbi:DUF2141 domain-containing protein [Polaribacter sargassicola]|uniref:DUF2141 domain-containing protein n=1 Tax=Polaribacter sargassicola TaxID=2836891 RepID=UPI001F2D9FAD|nr:DUF2141 domain-containing protein [Polaribacter sp. DS7-9]MCG1035633.1 DUF2141 domain-containing protein [Polaribacter sp. DS7-9]
MKKLLLVFAIIFTGILTTNAQEESLDLTVNISGLGSDKGTLMVALYNKPEHFLKKQFKGEIAKIKDKKSVVIFKGLPKGEYAVSFVHDENNNKKMDTNMFKIPKEDYGCSNNARGFMGPPKYDDAKFQLSENKTIEIKI